MTRTASILGLVLALSPSLAAQGGKPIFAHEVYDTFGSADLATGDFDEDGRPDLAAALTGTQLRRYRGLGDGLFEWLGSLPIPNDSHQVAVGDMNGDGHDDLVVVDVDVQIPKITMFVGDGQGGFTLAVQVAEGQGASDLQLADLDNDGDLDSFYADAIVPNVTIVHTGNFPSLGATFVVPVLGANPKAVAATDADQDGVPEILAGSIGSGTGHYQVFQRTGPTTYTQLSSGTVTKPSAFAFGDMTGDGKLDMLVTSFAPDTCRVFALGANGAFAPPSSTSIDNQSIHFALADVNGDGKLDAVVSQQFQSMIQVLLGDGAGNVASLPAQTVDADFLSFLSVDTNSDGAADLVANIAFGQVVTAGYGFAVYTGNGSGIFGGMGTTLSSALFLTGLTVADFNNDGFPDIARTENQFSSPQIANLCVHLSQGPLSYAPPTSMPIVLETQRLAVGDFDLDGTADIVGNHENASSIFHGNGNGTFSLTGEVPTLAGAPKWVLVGDFNGNGAPDLLLNFPTLNALAYVPNDPGTGFAAAQAIAVPLNPKGLAVGDVNLDGALDAVVGSFDSYTVLLGNGAGGFTASTVSTASQSLTLILSAGIGDVGGDGIPDLVLATSDSEFAIFTGLGGGTFVNGPTQIYSGSVEEVVVTDLNRDGKTDLVMANAKAENLSVFLGNGTTVPQPPHRHIGAGAFGDLAVVDLDVDGNPDVVAASGSGQGVSLFRNILGGVTGVSAYGTGTLGCQGKHGISVKDVPAVGNPNFGITSTNAPPTALGLGAYASFPDVAGTDLFQIGLTIHLDFVTSPTTGTFDLHSDAGGNGLGPLPIPNFPWLVGSTYYFQVYWVFGPSEGCHPSPIGFSSSPGMAVTIQP